MVDAISLKIFVVDITDLLFTRLYDWMKFVEETEIRLYIEVRKFRNTPISCSLFTHLTTHEFTINEI